MNNCKDVINTIDGAKALIDKVAQLYGSTAAKDITRVMEIFVEALPDTEQCDITTERKHLHNFDSCWANSEIAEALGRFMLKAAQVPMTKQIMSDFCKM